MLRLRRPILPFLLILNVAWLGSSACNRSSPNVNASVAAGSEPRDRATAGASPAHDAVALALAPVVGGSPRDLRILRLQHQARAQPELESTWSLLGNAWVQKARESSDPGYYLNANAAAEVMLSRNQYNRTALSLRSLVLLNRHQFLAAKASAEASIALDPRDPLAWGSLSDAELELGNFEAAVSAVEHMLELKPDLPAYSRAAHIQWLRGEEDEAIATIRLAIDAGLSPSDPEPLAWVLVQAATLFWHRGDLPGAAAGYEQALAVLKDYPPALQGLGHVALARLQTAQAVSFLRAAFAQSPLVETAWLLGNALQAAGDPIAAAQAFADAERVGLSSDPRTLALMNSVKGSQPQRALQLARQEHRLRSDVNSEDVLAWALRRAGDLNEARRVIDRACRLGTRDARLLFHRGAIHLATGDGPGGRRLIEQALAQNPTFDVDEVAEARSLLTAGGAQGRRIATGSAE